MQLFINDISQQARRDVSVALCIHPAVSQVASLVSQQGMGGLLEQHFQIRKGGQLPAGQEKSSPSFTCATPACPMPTVTGTTIWRHPTLTARTP